MSTVSEQEYETRIRQLEKLNATLATEIDLRRLLCDAAIDVYHGRRHPQDLWLAVRAFEKSREEKS